MENQQGQDGDIRVVNIPPLAQELRELLANDHSLEAQLGGSLPSCTIVIAEVRPLTRNVDEAMYDPHHVSIGPYHLLNNKRLVRSTEKIRSLGAVLSAASGGTPLDVEVYIQALDGLEVQARKCYANSFGSNILPSRDFVRMLLLDGCYLLVNFCKISGGGRRSNSGADMPNGHVQVGTPSVPAAPGFDRLETLAVVRDVFYLAENQIPFLVLDKILQITVSDPNAHAADRIMWFVQELLQGLQYSVAMPPQTATRQAGNLLHLLHMHFEPTNPPPPDMAGDAAPGGKEKTLGRWRTATEYYFVGVTFKPRPLDAGGKVVRSILDVNLDGGTLEIPPLNIDAETWRLLHNLMALEQRNPGAAGNHVTAYCVFMSQLACTAADVDLLSSKGIIAHGLGNNGEVAHRFADLCKGIMFTLDDPRGNYLRGICWALEERFQSRFRRWTAWLVRKYFDNPWLFIGLVAAAVGLACTVVQAVYAVLSYK
ncbi:unnamed protein product [Urochloa decumbens]|uniref:Uncharacterized protein n=1 Tax=Urochloa decumbens TaxID=240449 RepID=A0ABC9C1Q1_9POAL